jgi:hypothetical protein
MHGVQIKIASALWPREGLAMQKAGSSYFPIKSFLVQMFSSILQKEATHYNIGNANDARLKPWTQTCVDIQIRNRWNQNLLSYL